MTARKIQLKDKDELLQVLGSCDEHLKLIRRRLGIKAVIQGLTVKLSGSKNAVTQAQLVLERLTQMVRACIPVDSQTVTHLLTRGTPEQPEQSLAQTGGINSSHAATMAHPLPVSPMRCFKPLTKGQEQYVKTMEENPIVFSIGPAGTGKTYLAVGMAIEALRAGKVRRIILARPAVEAGERLGFLPGDYHAKVNPYLRPLYDALYSLLEFEKVRSLLDTQVIEVVPLAYMRGRTLEDAFIILDEAQNTTSAQMKMFLTRMGRNSRLVVTGDITQIDLPPGKLSGLVEARMLLRGIDGIAFSHLTTKDIVRHPLVEKIVAAYERRERRQRKAGKRKKEDEQDL
jgi:phosphate starvation-inducible PhoH-like protein